MAFIDVIKYEGSSNVLVFKHPVVDYNKHAQLIVHNNQKAIVLINGEMKGIYEPGKYTLESENLPGIKHMVALISGGELANHCEVFFFNELLFSNIVWVTSPMDIQDATIGNYFQLQAQGFCNVRINSLAKLFDIIGTDTSFTKEDLKEYCKEPITTAAKESLSIAMSQEGYSYGEINSHFSMLSELVFNKVKPAFEEIGLSLEKLWFDSVILDKDQEYDEHRQQLSNRSGQKIEGYSYAEKRAFDVLEKQAENPGMPGTMAGAAAGAVMGVQAGQVVGGLMGQVSQTVSNAVYGGSSQQINSDAGIVKPHEVGKTVLRCKKCGKELQKDWACCPFCREPVSSRTCPKCGKPLPADDSIKFCCFCSAPLNES